METSDDFQHAARQLLILNQETLPGESLKESYEYCIDRADYGQLISCDGSAEQLK